MRFIAERLEKDSVINYLIEFGWGDIGAVYEEENVMYVKGEPIIISSVDRRPDEAFRCQIGGVRNPRLRPRD